MGVPTMDFNGLSRRSSFFTNVCKLFEEVFLGSFRGCGVRKWKQGMWCPKVEVAMLLSGVERLRHLTVRNSASFPLV